MDFDANLAPYDLPHHATWWHLSNFINQTVINRLRKFGGCSTSLFRQVEFRYIDCWRLFIGLDQERWCRSQFHIAVLLIYSCIYWLL